MVSPIIAISPAKTSNKSLQSHGPSTFWHRGTKRKRETSYNTLLSSKCHKKHVNDAEEEKQKAQPHDIPLIADLFCLVCLATPRTTNPRSLVSSDTI